MQTQDVRVVMLPKEVDKFQRGLYKSKSGIIISFIIDFFGWRKEHWVHQHLYFTSDEEIKEGDWYWNKVTNTIHKAISLAVCIKGHHSDFQKIVASTDPLLNLPAIPEEWIRNKYVPSNGKINSVKLKVIKVTSKTIPIRYNTNWVEHILQLTAENEVVIVDSFVQLEQPDCDKKAMVDKELEDAANESVILLAQGLPDIASYNRCIRAFKAGADWKEKRMWTDEDMLAFAAYQGQKATSNQGFYFESEALQWLEDYKKKHK